MHAAPAPPYVGAERGGDTEAPLANPMQARAARLTPAFPLGRALALLVLVLAAIAIAAHFGLDPRRLAEFVQARRAFAGAHPTVSALAYALTFIVFAALALPGAWMVSVAGGALFGPWFGLPLVLASSTAGATIAMLTVRYALRDAAAARFPEFAAKVDEGVARDGARWLAAARLTPLIPFFAVNVAVGLTRMPAWVFAAASIVGSTPIALVYVLAGARLATIRSLHDAASPATLAALVALGLLAFALKPIARWRGARASEAATVAPKARRRD